MSEPNPNPAPEPKAPSSGDIVTDKTLAHVKKLEAQNATFEDKLKAMETRNGELEKIVSGLRNIPSPTVKGKSLLDTLTDFVFGDKPATPPENPTQKS